MAASKSRNPLVSCIMPTRNRAAFVPLAIRLFLRQEYPAGELIVVDDSRTALPEAWFKDCRRIKYIRLTRPQRLGEKRNIACESATGEVILHWDDDDWMAPWRIGYQLDGLRQSRADLCGLHTMLFYDPACSRVWEYRYPDKLLAGGSLCYWKATWKRNPFEQMDMGEDTRFVQSVDPDKRAALKDNRFYVAITHRGNTNPRNPNAARWFPRPVSLVHRILGEDRAFYTNIPLSSPIA